VIDSTSSKYHSFFRCFPVRARKIPSPPEGGRGHARVLLSAAEPDALAEKIVAQGLSVWDAETLLESAAERREDNRRISSGGQVHMVLGLAMKRGTSVDFYGYWQRRNSPIGNLSV
jgi:hypothetical protein